MKNTMKVQELKTAQLFKQLPKLLKVLPIQEIQLQPLGSEL